MERRMMHMKKSVCALDSTLQFQSSLSLSVFKEPSFSAPAKNLDCTFRCSGDFVGVSFAVVATGQRSREMSSIVSWLAPQTFRRATLYVPFSATAYVQVALAFAVISRTTCLPTTMTFSEGTMTRNKWKALRKRFLISESAKKTSA